uniref:Uncharacterized protein n=1 Tax=Vitis vinifera TaxID=29760 RepID=A5AKC9_VITVI|nr:hypothetical protein VITISV_032563 [Vitis vinifera]
MRKFCGGDIVRPKATRFATNYIALDSLLKKKRVDLKKLFKSDQWAQQKLNRIKIGQEMEKLMFDHPYWDKVTKVVSLYEPLYVVLLLVDSEVVPTMPFVYDLMQVMKENLIRQQAREWMFEIIKAYFLNPRFQYRRGVGSDPEPLQAIHDVFVKLDPIAESLSQFGNELKLRDVEVENDRVVEKDYLDLLDISIEMGEEEDNQLFQWVRPLHLDDEIRNPNPRIVAHAREFGVDVDRVMFEEVHSRIDDEGDNAGGDVGQQQQSQYPMSPFTYEDDFTHCTQDEDHDSRKVGPSIGAIGNSYRGREQTMAPPFNEQLFSASFESISIRTQFSDSSNEVNVYPPYVMVYGQPLSSMDEEYGMPSHSPSTQMSYDSYHIPCQMQGGFDTSTWVNLKYPIHVEAVGKTQEIYAWHLRIFNQYYRDSLTWYQYCLQQQDGIPSSINSIESHRSSFWY